MDLYLLATSNGLSCHKLGLDLLVLYVFLLYLCSLDLLGSLHMLHLDLSCLQLRWAGALKRLTLYCLGCLLLRLALDLHLDLYWLLRSLMDSELRRELLGGDLLRRLLDLDLNLQ